MFVIMNHYGNENIGEFGKVHVFPELYKSLEAAKNAAKYFFKEEEGQCISDDNGTPEPHEITADMCGNICINLDTPVCIIGRYDQNNFDGNHNIYAIFELVNSKKVIEPGKKYVFFFRSTDGDCKELVKYNCRLCTVKAKSDFPVGENHQGLYDVEFEEIDGKGVSDIYEVYGEELEEVEDCIRTDYGIYILQNF